MTPSLDAGFALAFLAEETAHTLAAPAAFLDGLRRQVETGGTLDPEDISILVEETARLRKLVSELRTIRPPPLAKAPVRLGPVLERARRSCAEVMAARSVQVHQTMPAMLVVDGDERALTLILRRMVGALVARADVGSEIQVMAARQLAGDVFAARPSGASPGGGHAGAGASGGSPGIRPKNGPPNVSPGVCVRIEGTVTDPLDGDLFAQRVPNPQARGQLAAFTPARFDLALARRVASAAGAKLVQERDGARSALVFTLSG